MHMRNEKVSRFDPNYEIDKFDEVVKLMEEASRRSTSTSRSAEGSRAWTAWSSIG